MHVPLVVIDDPYIEPDQTIVIELAHAWGASLGTNQSTFTIIDNDSPPVAPQDSDNDGLPDDWELANGLAPNDPGTTSPDNGPLGDPEGDELPNLLEFAVGNDPSVHDSVPLSLAIEVEADDGQSYVNITYSRRINSPGIQIEAEFSEDLKTWLPINDSNSTLTSTTPNPDGTTESITRRLASPLKATNHIRLKATSSASR